LKRNPGTLLRRVVAARQIKADIVGVATLADSFPEWWLKWAERKIEADTRDEDDD
jgi:hypothetical protein